MASVYDFSGGNAGDTAELQSVGKSLRQSHLPKDTLVKLLKVQGSGPTELADLLLLPDLSWGSATSSLGHENHCNSLRLLRPSLPSRAASRRAS